MASNNETSIVLLLGGIITALGTFCGWIIRFGFNILRERISTLEEREHTVIGVLPSIAESIKKVESTVSEIKTMLTFRGNSDRDKGV